MSDVYAPQSSSNFKEFVKSFQADGTAVFDQVNFEDLDFSKIFGQITTSTTQNAVAYGIKGFTLDYDNNSIQVGYPLQCRSLDDSDCFMQGVVTLKDQTYSPAYIEVAVTIISPLVNTTNNWELSVIPLAGFSINPSATVGISTTSIDASGAGPFTFTTQTGKLFMQPEALQGTVVCAALSDPKTYLFGRIIAVDGTNLVLDKIYSNATSAVTAWSIQMFDGPDDGVPFNEIYGLRVSQASGDLVHDLLIRAGSIRDSSDTIDLVLTDDIIKRLDADFVAGTNQGAQVKSDLLAGTVTISSTTVTGVGTSFTTDFQGNSVFNATGSTPVDIGTITNDTSMTISSAAGNVTGATYRRGGYTTLNVAHSVVLARKDSDGSIDVIAASLNAAGVPDLPSGYTYYRIIATVVMITGSTATLTPAFSLVENAPIVTIFNHASLTNQHVLSDSTTITSNSAGAVGSRTVELRRAALTGDVTASANSNATTLSSTAITNKTEKTALVDDDLFLIADSEASFALKKVKNVNAGGGGSGASFPADMGSITEAPAMTFDCGTVP